MQQLRERKMFESLVNLNIIGFLGLGFVFFLFLYLVIYRKYQIWIENIGICHPGEHPIYRFYKLFGAYAPLTLLISILLTYSQSSLTLNFDIVWFIVYFWSTSIILFLIRGLETTYIFINIYDPKNILYTIINAFMLTSIVGTCNVIINYGLHTNQVILLIESLLNTPNIIMLKGIDVFNFTILVLIPLIFVSSLGEVTFYLMCIATKTKRKYAPQKNTQNQV